METATKHVLGPDEGEAVNLLALGVRFMIDGERTGGAFSLVEHPLPPRALGSPVHTHSNEDEYTFVLDGRVGVQLGDDVIEAGPGELVFKPRGVAHAFWNAGDEAAIGEVVGKYELDIDFATIPVLAERHGLRLG